MPDFNSLPQLRPRERAAYRALAAAFDALLGVLARYDGLALLRDEGLLHQVADEVAAPVRALDAALLAAAGDRGREIRFAWRPRGEGDYARQLLNMGGEATGGWVRNLFALARPSLHTHDGWFDFRNHLGDFRDRVLAALKPAATRSRTSVEEANKEAMRLAGSMGKAFFAWSDARQAKKIGCDVRTWRKTTFYREARRKLSRMRPPTATKKPSRRAVSLTPEVEAVTGQGEPDELLQRLMEQQEADREPSPCDPRPFTVRVRKRV
jgi:hypothetical protein